MVAHLQLLCPYQNERLRETQTILYQKMGLVSILWPHHERSNILFTSGADDQPIIHNFGAFLNSLFLNFSGFPWKPGRSYPKRNENYTHFFQKQKKVSKDLINHACTTRRFANYPVYNDRVHHLGNVKMTHHLLNERKKQNRIVIVAWYVSW